MTGRGTRKRGRPPKTPNERGSKFSYQLLKKPKYLSKGPESQFSTPSASRASSPPESDGSRRSFNRCLKSKPTRGRGRRSAYNQAAHTPYSSRKGYESEYHYGSDFGDSTDKSDAEDDPLLMSPTEEESVDGENESESEFSECSFSQTGLSRPTRPPSPDPIWLQNREFATLTLPKSSEDLLISNNLSLKAVTIYEVLRRFRHLVRLSPFRIEDFCASLICEEQSALFIEIHIMLLKAILREEDLQTTHFGPLDQKDSVNISLFLIDNITWPEVLRCYVESDLAFDRSVYEILQSKDYPYSSVQDRLHILQFLTDQLLNTTAVRDVMLQEGPIHYDDHCRVCHRLGDLLCCETCPAVFHLECVDPPLVDVPTEDWQCNLCQSHKVTGVIDCISSQEKQGVLIRHETLGVDRHGRKYWFIARRIFIEDQSGNETWYYTTTVQFEQLFALLDANELELNLCKELLDKKDEIHRQMKITEKLTNENRFNKRSYIDFENDKITQSLCNETECIEKDEETSSESRLTRQKTNQINNGTFYFKLGMENGFKNYINQYTVNSIALNKPQRNEERDKRRHLSHKFSLTTASEFKWIGNSHGSSSSVVNTMRQTLLNFEQSIASSFMNTNWSSLRKMWIAAVANSNKPSDFSQVLLLLQACFKSVIFANVWHEQLGHIRFHRTTSTEREERKKIEKREKRERDDEEERNRLAFNYVKYSLGLKHQVWKQKGEEYRIHGQWGWIWMSYSRQHQRSRRSQKKICACKVNIRISHKGEQKVISVDPRTYTFLKQCERASKTGLEYGYIDDFRDIEIVEFDDKDIDVIDVSKSLTATGRLLFPKIGRKCKLDDLLSKRLLLKEAEEQIMSTTDEGKDSNLQNKLPVKPDSTSTVKPLLLEKQILRLIEQKQNSQSNSVNLDLVNTLAKKIQSVRLQFSLLNKFAKQYRCYTKDCNTNSNAVSQITQNTCYSPLCLQKARAKKELLLLLRKAHTAGNGSKETVAAILGAVKKPSILEQKLMEGKKDSNTLLDDPEEKQFEESPIDLKQDFQNSLENAVAFDDNLIASCFSQIYLKQEIDIKSENENMASFQYNSPKSQDPIPSDVDNYVDTLDVCSNVEVESTDAILDNNEVLSTKKKKQKLRTKNNKESSPNQISDQNTLIVRQNRRFPLHPPRVVKREDNLKLEPEYGPDGSEKIYSASSTRGKIYLLRELNNLKERQQPPIKNIISKFPIISNFYTSNLHKSLMVLPKYELLKLGRTGGKIQVNGYHHLAKNNTSVWPYPCSRPLFKTCWIYRTTNCPTIASVALQLRILYCCLRWDDMIAKPLSLDGKYQITTETEIVTQELLKLKHCGKFNERTQYLRRKVVIPLELPKTVREVTSIRSGLRKRKRAESPQQTEPQVSEEWVDEDKLELWEIKLFGEKQEKIRNSINGRHAQLKQNDAGPNSSSPGTSVGTASKTSGTKLTNEEIKEKMEQQLKLQRAAHQQKKSTDVKQSIVKANPPITNRRVIVKNPDGTTRIIHQAVSTNLQSKTTSVNNVTSKVNTNAGTSETTQTTQPTQHKVQIIRGPDGKVSVRGLSPGQQLIQMPDGKLHVLTTTQGINKNISQKTSTTIVNKSAQTSVTPSTVVKQITVKPTKPVTSGISLKQVVNREAPQKVLNSIAPATQAIRSAASTPVPQTVHKIVTTGGPIVQANSTAKSSNLQQLIVQPGQKLLVGQNAQGQKVLISSPTQPPPQSTQNVAQAQQILLHPQPAQKVIQQIVNTSSVQQQIMVGGQRIILSPGQTIVTQRSVPQSSQVQVLQQQIIQPAQPQQQMVLHAQPQIETRTAVSKIKVQNQIQQSQNQTMQQQTSNTEIVSQPTQQQLVVQNSALAQQLAQGKLQVATVNGQQVIIKPLGNNQAQIVAHIKTQSDGNAHIVTNANFPDNSKETPNTTKPSPKVVHQQKAQVRISEQTPNEHKTTTTEQSHAFGTSEEIQTQTSTIEQNLLQGQPPGTVIKCVTAQVIQTEHGPRIVLQGLVGNDFTQQQLTLVQQQVKQQLLKAQESSGKQGVLGPTKIYLAVQPTNSVVQNTHSQTPAAVQQVQEIQNNSRIDNPESKANDFAQLLKETDENKTDNNQKDMNVSNLSAKTVKKLVSTNLENPSFVVTPDYIQQTIKNALKQENLNPEIEEKLINLQKYQERQMKSDPTSTLTSSPNTNHNSPTSLLNITRKRYNNTQEDEECYGKIKKTCALSETTGIDKEKSEFSNSTSNTTSNGSKAKTEMERKRAALHLNRLHRHKELLKKDILKKRAILEKTLHIEIQREISSEVPECQKTSIKSFSKPGSSIEKLSHNNSFEIDSPKLAFGNKMKKNSKFPGMSRKREKLYCICRTPYDDTKFYVGCDLCSNWFHGECVEITEEASKKLSEFVCEECRRARDTQELYCSCKQPYDESQFYICCDKCQDWFHGRCVGIVQSEAEFIDEYICPDCQRNNAVNMANMKSLTNNEYAELRKLIKQMQNHKNAWPFMEPVDPDEAPDYYKVIKEPMDLKKVEKKIYAHVYTKLSEFIGDMTKIFDNCRYYNSKESTFYKCAESLEGYFVQKIKNFRESVVAQN